VHVTAGDREIRGTRFDKAGWCGEIFNLPRVGRRGNQHGIFAGVEGRCTSASKGDGIARGTTTPSSSAISVAIVAARTRINMVECSPWRCSMVREPISLIVYPQPDPFENADW